MSKRGVRYLERLLSHRKFVNPNPRRYFLFEDFMASRCRETVIWGANRIGKSETGAYKAAVYLQGWDPTHPDRPVPVPSKGWIITDADNVPVVLEKLDRWLAPGVIVHSNNSQGNWYRRSAIGAEIWVKTHDQERRKFQGQDLDWIWWDEEPRQEIYDECRMRLIDRQGKMWWTLTPVDGTTWLHEHLRGLHKKYRKARRGPLCWINAGLMHNPYIPLRIRKAEAARLKVELKGREDAYRIRVLGEYIILGGSPLFLSRDLEAIYSREPRVLVGDVRDSRFDPRTVEAYDLDGGWLELWELPKPGNQYAIGADIAMGLKDGDFSCAWILNRTTHEQAGIWHGHIEPYKFGLLLCRLGKLFNMAVINPEANPPGNSTIDAMRHKGYPRVSRRQKAKNEMVSMQNAFGAWTSAVTKPMWVHALQNAVGEHAFTVKDIETIEEMRRFRRANRQKKELGPGYHGYGAISGHDDRVMALIHAWQAHIHAAYFKSKPKQEDDDPALRNLLKYLSGRRVGGVRVNPRKLVGVG